MPRVLFVGDGSSEGGLEAGLPAGTVVSRDRRRLNPLAMLLGRWDAVPADVVHMDGRRAVVAAGVGAFRCYQKVRLVYSGCGHVRWRGADVWEIVQLRDADAVIARTAAEEGRYLGVGVPAAKIRRVPYAAPAALLPPLPRFGGEGWGEGVASGCNASSLIPNANPLTPTLSPEAGERGQEGRRLLVAAGALVPAADHPCAVFAFNGLRYAAPDARLVIAGVGPERQKLLDFARNAAFEDNRVTVVPPTPDQFTGAEQAWVTHRTGGCRAALEAMAAGVPVLAADTPDLREVVGDAGLFFPPGDRGRLCELAFRLLEDPARGRALGEAGRQRAIDQFPPQRLADALAAVYHEVGAL